MLLRLFISLTLCATGEATTYNNIQLLEKALKNRTPIDTRNNLFSKGNENGPITGFFLSDAEIKALTEKLVAAYKKEPMNPPIDQRDVKVIEALKKNLAGFYIYEPELKFSKKYSNSLGTFDTTPVYKITGWKLSRLTDSDRLLENFFKLFLAGAHFVILGQNNLLHDINVLFASAKNNKHSHYQETKEALVFPNITWHARNPAPIVAALLIDNVKIPGDSIPKTFFQLEGWPVHADSNLTDDTLLHAKDFILHRNTLWNISTYGMSPYSEKRGTTVFMSKDLIPSDKLIKEAKKTFSSDYLKYSEDMR